MSATFFNNLIKTRPYRFIFLSCVVLPGAALVGSLNLARAFSFEQKVGLLGALDSFKGPLFLLLGLGLLGALSLQWAPGKRQRVALLAFWQIIWLLVGILEIAGHQFFVATGSSLDYYLLAFSLQNFSDNAEVIGSEVPKWVLWAIPLYALTILGAPWAAYLRLKDARVGAAKTQKDASRFGARALGLGALAIGLIIASAASSWSKQPLPLSTPTTTTIARSATQALNSALSPQSDAVASAREIGLEKSPQEEPSKPRNVVFVVLESTRASSVTPYNPKLSTTPYLADLAMRSTLVENAYAVVPHSSKALVAILCGVDPNLSMPITESLADNIPARCLAELLDEQGYRTAFFQSAREDFENRRQLVKNMGYRDFTSGNQLNTEGFSKANYFGYEDDIMLEPSKDWLKENADQPFFVTYFTVTPHHPYDAPKRYGRHDFAEDDLLNRYLNSVHYLDNFVKNIIEQYEELGLLDESIFVLVGDHGEGLGEHGRSQHDNVIYQEGIRIPMMIFDPQDPTPRRIQYNANHLDLVPSIIDRLGFEVIDGAYPGQPLWEINSERPMHAHCWYERRCMARVIGDEKYIHHFNSQPDEFFNLGEDPEERKDLAASRSDLQEWLAPLKQWREEVISVHRTHARDHLKEIALEELPQVDHPLDARFGDEAKLRGYDISRTSARPFQPIELTWYFESLKKMGPDWQLFIHAEHENGKFKNFDHIPADGLAPLDTWKPGTFIVDAHIIRLPRDWPPGEVTIYIGLWNKDTSARKEVSGEVAKDAKNRAEALRLQLTR